MKTSELRGAALDWAVAKCEFPGRLDQDIEVWVTPLPCDEPDDFKFQPSTDWMQGGPIIGRERLGVWFSEAVHDENGKVLREACWYCETCCTTDNGDEPYRCEIGDTPLIAAMRCYVASKLGDEIEIPEELK